MSNFINQLNHYMDAGFPILYIETLEELKVDKFIAVAAKNQNFEIVEYSARGFADKTFMNNLNEVLAHCIKPPEQNEKIYNLNRKVLVLKDALQFLEKPDVTGKLKYIAERILSNFYNCRIVIVAPFVKLPKELEHLITVLSTDYPQSEEISEIIDNFCAAEKITPPLQRLKQKLIDAFKGMAEFEIRNVLALAAAKDGTINEDDLNLIHEQKRQTVQKSGILDMIQLDAAANFFENTGGLYNLKRCLKRKQKIFENLSAAESFGVDRPKGLLIAGLPGCGKSLSVKAAAALFKIPLVQLDMGRVMGKYVGESESNLRRAIKQADAISPCILWLDELEKAFSGVGGLGVNAELTTRLFGTFLTWMQEKTSLSFVMATVNNIKNIPPEFLRKGRFDEIFYVDLPSEEERVEILRIHIKKRRPQDLPNIDLNAIARKTEGFSGADIEGIVKDAIEETFNQNVDTLSNAALLDALEQTQPLSKTMKDEIDEMRQNYKKRNFKNAS